MRFHFLSYALAWVYAFSLVAAQPQMLSAVRVESPPGKSDADVVYAVRRELARASNGRRDRDYKVNSTLDRSWNGAVLLQLGAKEHVGNAALSESVEIVCSTCYVKGVATGELSFSKHFNFSQAADRTISQVGQEVKNLTKDVKDYFEDWLEKDVGNLERLDFHPDDYAFPTFNVSLEMDVPEIPEAILHFKFHDLEVYMLMDATLSLDAAYTINLFTSDTIVGFALTDKLRLGLTFAFDLILDTKGSIDISGGFHIKLDQVAVDIALFADDVHGIMLNGGHFEFLPVTVESAGITFSAFIRVSINAGFNLKETGGLLSLITFDNHSLTFSGGIGVSVFANIAEFTTTVTAQPDNSTCELGVVQSYQLALGATAGATVALDTYTWGPAPQTSVPIWYTELDSGCAMTRTSQPTATPNVTLASVARKRQDLSTATITTVITHTGVRCMTTGIVNCPVSLQNTTQSTTTSTLVTAVSSGMDTDDITFPATVQNAVTTTATFGANAVKLTSTSGSPVSYVPPPPPPPPTASSSTVLPPAVHAKGHKKRLIIGLSIGLGLPALLAIAAAAAFLLLKRRRYSAVPTLDSTRDSTSRLMVHGKQPAYSEIPVEE